MGTTEAVGTEQSSIVNPATANTTSCQSESAFRMDTTNALLDDEKDTDSNARKALDESYSNDAGTRNDALLGRASVTPRSSTSRMSTDSNTGDPRFFLPKCGSPPQQEMEVVAMFVSKAVREEHQKSGELKVSSKEYRAIGDAIRLQKDVQLLLKVLIALRTSALQYLSADTKIHARLIHLIMKFVPFPNRTVQSMLTPMDPLDETVDNFDLADAHLNLMTALVSANSLYVVPAVTAVWKMLTFRITDSHKERYDRHHSVAVKCYCPAKSLTNFDSGCAEQNTSDPRCIGHHSSPLPESQNRTIPDHFF